MIGFLIGFMGSGKSTLGKAILSEGKIPFIDLDDFIVVRAGKPITAIFDEGGEVLFRKLEQEALQSLIEAKPENILIACGGGTPCFGENLRYMKEAGETIYLQTPVKELARRLLPQKSHRPLIKHLRDDELEGFIQDLLKKRESYYLEAQHILEPAEQNVSNIYKLLLP